MRLKADAARPRAARGFGLDPHARPDLGLAMRSTQGADRLGQRRALLGRCEALESVNNGHCSGLLLDLGYQVAEHGSTSRGLAETLADTAKCE